jgi:hypothetical protein
MENPMTPSDLAQKVRALKRTCPTTADFEQALFSRKLLDPFKEARKYPSQQQHWIGWLSEYGGPGYYGRKRWDRDAKFVYNHVGCPPMLLWLAEASGVSKPKLDEAVRIALRRGQTLSGACAAIRRVIAWKDVEEKLRNV